MNEELENYLIRAHWGNNEETKVPPEECLYHYTSADAFLNIVGSEGITLWASRIDCLNDKMEWLHALEIYKNVCDLLLKSGEITKDFYQKIFCIKPAQEQLFIHWADKNIITSHQDKCAHFICCFSKDSDSLPMWNYYSKSSARSGYNIGFFNQNIVNSKNDHMDSYRYHTYKVIYDDLKKYNIISRRLKELSNLTHSLEDLEIVANEISYFLLEWAATFKCSDFAYENEVRLLVDVPVSALKENIKYRPSNGLIIPYIEVHFPRNILSYVKIGPLSCLPEDRALQIEIIKERLDLYGYRNADVSNSKVPIRF